MEKETEKQELASEEDVKKVKMVSKKVTCPRCKGDGIWHSSRTGVRALTASGPPVDATRVCPKCKGRKKVTIMITEEQARKEHAVRVAKHRAEAAAKKARVTADAAAKAAKKAEEQIK